MINGYYVYSGVKLFAEPVASFTKLEDALKLSELIGSHIQPKAIEGEYPSDIDKYLSEINSGLHPYDVALYADGTIFEIGTGLDMEDGVLLTETQYFPIEGTFSGTFWANEIDEAVEIARTEMKKLQQ